MTFSGYFRVAMPACPHCYPTMTATYVEQPTMPVYATSGPVRDYFTKKLPKIWKSLGNKM